MTILIDDLMNLATFAVECLPEDSAIDGNCMASGDDAFDRKCAAKIRRQLASGNDWAWCTVKVSATLGDLTGTDYLGCCSYASKADFIAPGGYYDDMKTSALDDLRAQLAAVIKSVPASMLQAELSDRGIDA